LRDGRRPGGDFAVGGDLKFEVTVSDANFCGEADLIASSIISMT
jgi:hypothetical protein